jgi:hypothetical protein
MIFECLGALIAAVLFMFLRPEDYEEDGEPDLKRKLVSEFTGTFILCCTVGFNVLLKSPAGAWSIAAALMVAIYALGNKKNRIIVSPQHWWWRFMRWVLSNDKES